MTAGRHHATTVAISGHAVMMFGVSGAGKSDLALRLIDRGAMLVSDDQTLLSPEAGRLLAAPPETIAGLIEVRGVGIVRMPYENGVPVALIVHLDRAVPRMPDMGATERLDGIALPVIALDPAEGSAPIKVELALRRAIEDAA